MNDLIVGIDLGTTNSEVAAFTGSEVRVRFDAGCSDPAVLGRLETNPPAGLYGAPESRQKSVLRDPDALKKLSI